LEKYVLPDLDYDYAALEPHISAKIMELHHSKHHLAYVNGANQALEGLKEAQETKNFARVAPWSTRWPSISQDTSCIRCSGRTCPRTAAVSRTAIWPRPSTAISVPLRG